MSKKMTNNQVLMREVVNQEFSDDSSFENIGSFFEFFSASQVLKDYNLSDEEVEKGIVGGGNDGGCDGVYVFLNNELLTSDQIANLNAPRGSNLTLAILQSKNVTGFGEDSIMKWKTTSSNLLDMSKDVSSYETRYSVSVRDSFMLFRDALTKLIRSQLKIQIDYYYVTLAVEISDGVRQQVDELCRMVNELYPSAKINAYLIGADELMQLYNNDAHESVNIIFSALPISLGRNDEYIALVNLSDYYNFITDENGKLKCRYFEANVRDYQGKNTVNNAIADSLATESGEDFWWLNNGVTILSEQITPLTTIEYQIANPEIVNGLQTSTEIFNYFSNNQDRIGEDKRNVLVRIISPASEESRDNIIFATNNQTDIPKSSLRVTDPIHLQIEMYFKSRGLYYDRRKNYYKNQKKKSADIISVPFLAQCLITLFLRKPDFARARPSTLLTDEDTYQILYNEKIDLETYYKAAALGRKIRLQLKKTAEYSSAEKGDILYYLLYGSVATMLGKTNISFDDIKDFDIDMISEEHIEKIKDSVYKCYMENGGNGQVAKSSGFVDAVDVALGLN